MSGCAPLEPTYSTCSTACVSSSRAHKGQTENAILGLQRTIASCVCVCVCVWPDAPTQDHAYATAASRSPLSSHTHRCQESAVNTSWLKDAKDYSVNVNALTCLVSCRRRLQKIISTMRERLEAKMGNQNNNAFKVRHTHTDTHTQYRAVRAHTDARVPPIQ